MKKMISHLLKGTLDLLYPRRCPVCHDVVRERGALICAACEDVPAYIHEPFCMRCGKQMRDASRMVCAECAERDYPFLWNTALMSYDAVSRASIAKFKYEGRREYADWYARELLHRRGRRIRAAAPEAVVPVPVHPSRRRERGYNQAAALGERIAEELGIPLREDLLVRVRKTAAMKTLSAAGRAASLAGAFGPGEGRCPGGTVLLVDDIFTTGTTLSECALVLRALGAARVVCATVCVGVPDEEDDL